MAFDKTQDTYAGRTDAWHSFGYVNPNGNLLTFDDLVKNTDLGREFRKEQRTNKYTDELIRSWDVFRDDNIWIATVGERQHILSVQEAFGEADAMLREVLGAEAIYDTGGTLEHGAKRWALASVGEFNVLGLDPMKKFLALMDSVDATHPFKIVPTNVRIVCRNTYSATLREDATYSRKHTKGAGEDIKAKMEQITRALVAGNQQADEFNDLAQRSIQATEARNIVRQLFGIKPDVIEDDIPTVTKNRITNVFDLFEKNDDNAFPEFRGTAWNLLNAVSEYTDHEIDVRLSGAKSSLGYTADTARQYNALFGTGADIKAKALEIILEQTANAPRVNRLKSFSFSNQPSNLLDAILTEAGH